MTKTCVGCKYYVRSGDFHVYARVGYRCYVCANKGSDYYGAFLNIDEDGNNTNEIWPRCNKWTGKGGGR